MTCNILAAIEKYGMIQKGDSIAVGFSGGADSVCLLHFLSTIKEKYDIVLKAVHVNHNIRGEEALRDERFAESFCKELGVEFISFSVDVPRLSKEAGLSCEEYGRKVRYECFQKVNTDKIAVAHTLSDSAETLIFNLARGTGLKGVCGISPIRDNIIRPLIECSREDIEAYCAENSLPYVTDSTNLSDDYTRNKIRHNVIGTLKEINPGFEKCILRFTLIASEENRFLDRCAADLLEKAKCEKGFLQSELICADEAVLKRAAAMILKSVVSKEAEAKHIALCCDIIKKGKGASEIEKGVYIACENGVVFVRRADEKSAYQPWCVQALIGENRTPGGTFAISLRDSIIGENRQNCIAVYDVDTDKLNFRNRRPGDRFTDPKRKITKTLKKLFSEKKLAADDRNNRAILCCGDEILWVDGFGTQQKHLPDENAKKVLLVQKKEV